MTNANLAGRGWWHPEACIDKHDEDHNCLDADGSIIGWRDPVVSARLDSATVQLREADPVATPETLSEHVRRIGALWWQPRRVAPSPETPGLREAAQAALDLLPDLSVAFHQTGSIRDHADPKDRTGWNVHDIETCEDVYCLDALAAIAALRTALAALPAPLAVEREAIFAAHLDSCGKRIGDLEAALRFIADWAHDCDETGLTKSAFFGFEQIERMCCVALGAESIP